MKEVAMKIGMSRREFIKTSAFASAAMLIGGGCKILPNSPEVYDAFLIKNIHALIGEPQTFKLCDILIKNGKYAQIVDLAVNPGGINPGIPSLTTKLIDGKGSLYASPGWVDLHVHIGVSGYGYQINDMGLAHGVTALLDAGSAGTSNFTVVNNAIKANTDIDCFALLNINPTGILGSVTAVPDIEEMRACLNTNNAGKKTIVGLKHRADTSNTSITDREYYLRKIKEASNILGIPAVVHINSTLGVEALGISNVLGYLKSGDILCHALRENDNSIVNNGMVRDEVLAAYENGVAFDVAHGGASFSFDTAETAVNEGFRDFTISSDIYLMSKSSAKSFANVLTKFLVDGINMGLDEIMINASTKPAKFLGIERVINTNAEATMTIFSLKTGNFTMDDTLSQTRNCPQRIIPEWTIMKGKKLYLAGDYDRTL
jgi:dihydroorotase